MPKVSIITATYTLDRLTDVKQLLDSVNRQTNRDFEMIIVAERMPDLVEMISAYITENNYGNMTVIYNEGPGGASANRNLAIGQATGDIIAFVDDDAVVNSDWVGEIVRVFDEDESVIGVTGPIIPLWETGAADWVSPEFYWIFSCTGSSVKDRVEVRNGYCTNLSFNKEAFEKAGLFNTELGVKGHGRGGWQEPGGEETELAIRIKDTTGKCIVYDPAVIVQHKVYGYRLSRNFITRRAFWEGYAKALLSRRFRERGKKNGVLATEHSLLKKILFFRLPRTLKLLLLRPRIGCRQLGLIITVLSCVLAGYLRFYFEVGLGRNIYET